MKWKENKRQTLSPAAAIVIDLGVIGLVGGAAMSFLS